MAKRVRRGKKSIGTRIKRPIILAAVEPRGHSMHRNSGIVLYWLMLLALVVLNMLAVLTVPVLQLALAGPKIILIVAALGFFFGYVTDKLVNLVENLETMRHLLARLLVPAAAMANLFIISLATNSFVSYLGIGYRHDPVIISLAYGISFIIPSVLSGAVTAGAFLSGRGPAKS